MGRPSACFTHNESSYLNESGMDVALYFRNMWQLSIFFSRRSGVIRKVPNPPLPATGAGVGSITSVFLTHALLHILSTISPAIILDICIMVQDMDCLDFLKYLLKKHQTYIKFTIVYISK